MLASGSVLCELRKHGTTTGNAIYPVILQSAEAFTKLACSLTFEKEIQGSKQRKKKVYWFLLCLRQKPCMQSRNQTFHGLHEDVFVLLRENCP